MAIRQKLNSAINAMGVLIGGAKSAASTIGHGTVDAAHVSKEACIALIEKYKGVRRIILMVALWINIHIFIITADMYQKLGTIDIQWVVYAGYWSAILVTFIGFYTMSRVKEFQTDSPLAPKGEWVIQASSKPKTDDYIKETENSLAEERIELDGDALLEAELKEKS